jgi:hypothetical protein
MRPKSSSMLPLCSLAYGQFWEWQFAKLAIKRSEVFGVEKMRNLIFCIFLRSKMSQVFGVEKYGTWGWFLNWVQVENLQVANLKRITLFTSGSQLELDLRTSLWFFAYFCDLKCLKCSERRKIAEPDFLHGRLDGRQLVRPELDFASRSRLGKNLDPFPRLFCRLFYASVSALI